MAYFKKKKKTLYKTFEIYILSLPSFLCDTRMKGSLCRLLSS